MPLWEPHTPKPKPHINTENTVPKVTDIKNMQQIVQIIKNDSDVVDKGTQKY